MGVVDLYLQGHRTQFADLTSGTHVAFTHSCHRAMVRHADPHPCKPMQVLEKGAKSVVLASHLGRPDGSVKG